MNERQPRLLSGFVGAGAVVVAACVVFGAVPGAKRAPCSRALSECTYYLIYILKLKLDLACLPGSSCCLLSHASERSRSLVITAALSQYLAE